MTIIVSHQQYEHIISEKLFHIDGIIIQSYHH